MLRAGWNELLLMVSFQIRSEIGWISKFARFSGKCETAGKTSTGLADFRALNLALRGVRS